MGALGLAFRAIVHYSANMSAQCSAALACVGFESAVGRDIARRSCRF